MVDQSPEEQIHSSADGHHNPGITGCRTLPGFGRDGLRRLE